MGGRGKELDLVAILQLWLKYCEFQATQLEQSTMMRDYDKITKRLVKMPDLPNAVAIRDWLLKHYARETARRTLERLSACCDWSVRSGYITSNPFAPLSRDIRRPRRRAWIDTHAFTAAERDAIIQAIADDTYSKCPQRPHSFYANYIRFLFWTGCRLEEATPLQWSDIAPDFSAVTFSKALPSDTRTLKATKTHQSRVFPCNDRLRRLLVSLPRHSPYVFPSPKGRWIDSHNVLNRTWKPVLTPLLAARKVSQYLPMKHTRHTFITLALEAGMPSKDVAQLVGNTPEVIEKHYAAPRKQITVPEF